MLNNNNDNNDSNNDNNNNNDTSKPGCKHTNLRTVNKKDATCTQSGYTGDVYCVDCNVKVKSGSTIAATGHKNTELQGVKDATCTEDGYNGDLVCKTCGTTVEEGQVITAPGSHTFGEWKVVEEATDTTDGTKERSCSKCEYKETETIPATGTEDAPNSESESEESETQDTQNTQNTTSEPKNPLVVGAAIAVPSACALGVIATVILKKKNRS